MKKSLNIAAAALLLGSSAIAPAVFAQDATIPAAPQTPGVQTPADPGATSEPSTTTMPAPNTDSAANTGGYLTQQTETQVSANDFIGQPVYNATNENIGDINDLIIEEKGGIVAAVIGVGGFLGIGEKDVAVPMDKITITREADSGDVKLTTMETTEALKAAPEFQSLDDQKSARDNTMPTDSTTTSSTDNN